MVEVGTTTGGDESDVYALQLSHFGSAQIFMWRPGLGWSSGVLKRDATSLTVAAVACRAESRCTITVEPRGVELGRL